MSITIRYVFREKRLADLPLAALKEHVQIRNAFVKIGARLGVPSEDFVAQYETTTAEMEKILAKSKMAAKPLPNFKVMATDAGLGREHEEFYGLFSKIAHPSPWFLAAPSELFDSPAMRGILATRAVAYAEDVSTVLQKPELATKREFGLRLAAFGRGISQGPGGRSSEP